MKIDYFNNKYEIEILRENNNISSNYSENQLITDESGSERKDSLKSLKFSDTSHIKIEDS